MDNFTGLGVFVDTYPNEEKHLEVRHSPAANISPVLWKYNRDECTSAIADLCKGALFVFFCATIWRQAQKKRYTPRTQVTRSLEHFLSSVCLTSLYSLYGPSHNTELCLCVFCCVFILLSPLSAVTTYANELILISPSVTSRGSSLSFWPWWGTAASATTTSGTGGPPSWAAVTPWCATSNTTPSSSSDTCAAGWRWETHFELLSLCSTVQQNLSDNLINLLLGNSIFLTFYKSLQPPDGLCSSGDDRYRRAARVEGLPGHTGGAAARRLLLWSDRRHRRSLR